MWFLCSGSTKSSVGGPSYRQPQDEVLGFDAAVAAIGMKANVCEADHPLLCEATRRQVSSLEYCIMFEYHNLVLQVFVGKIL